jgi:hypothetical protein
MVSTPGGEFLGASFACRAIVERHGPAVDVRSADCTVLALPETPLAPGLDFSWQRYQAWEDRTLVLIRERGPTGLWTAAFEASFEVLGGADYRPTPALESEIQAAFRGLMALAEGAMKEAELLAYLGAFANQGRCMSRLLGGPVDVGEVLARWEEPWSLWPEALPFFEHLLFRKYLLEGPDVHSRICSLPVMSQVLQFLVHARARSAGTVEDFRWALRLLEERLTFHARGLSSYLGRCGHAFLEGLEPAV